MKQNSIIEKYPGFDYPSITVEVYTNKYTSEDDVCKSQVRSWLKTCVEKIDVFREKEKGKEKERKSLPRGESK